MDKKLKSLIEVDCENSLWNEGKGNSNNGWGQLESQLTFVYKTKSNKISEDDIHSALWDKYGNADYIDVSSFIPEEKEPRTRYFVATVMIYNSFICQTE